MIIRQMEEKDLEQVCQIEQESFSMPWTYKDFLSAIDGDELYYLKIYLVAENENGILGYCGLWGIAGEGQVNNVVVKEEFRNQHIGKLLLSELIQQGVGRGLESFTLEVRVSNESAKRLYSNMGFQVAGIRKDFYSLPTEDAIIMWLSPQQSLY